MYYITSGLHFSVQFTCIPGLYEGLQHWQISNDLWIKAVFLCEESTLPLPHDYCNKGKVCTQAEWPIQPELIWVSIAWNNQKYCYFSPWMWCQSIVKLSPNILSGFLEIMAVPNHTPDRRTVKVKCFIQEHYTIVRPQTWTTWPKVQCTDKQVTTSPTKFCDTSLVLMELNLALINLSSYKALSLHCE